MQAYKIMAKDSTGPTRLQKQFTSGHVITDLAEANRLAQEFAQEQSRRTRSSWTAVVETYVVGSKPGSL